MLMDQARESYDLVIVDTPPLLSATDAVAAGTLADANLFLVCWGRTPRAVVLAALRFFSLCRIAVNGIILTHVNLCEYERYGNVPDSIPYRRASYGSLLTTPPKALPPQPRWGAL